MSKQRQRSRTPLKNKKSLSKSPIYKNGNSQECDKEITKSQTVQQILDVRKKFINPMMQLHYKENPIKITKGEGQYLYDEDGSKYLDCANNVAHVGHANPEVVKKINYQFTQLNTNSRYLHDGVSIYTQKLMSKLPKELCVATFVNSGSEANDLALQFARIHSKNQNIVCIEGAYHGTTSSCMDVSPYKWNENYKQKDYVFIAKSPCQYRGEYIGKGAAQKYAQDLDKQLKGKKIAAFISEALQSCAGQIIPPLDYFKEMYKVVKKHGGVTIIDEVQSCLGRVGEHYWAFQIFDIVPDILVFGKSMGNGFPVAAVVTTREIADSFQKFNIDYFNTYGGNAPAMIASIAVFDFIEENNLQQKAAEVGKYLEQKLLELQNEFINIGNIRGYGLFYGIDCVKDRSTKEYHGELANFVSLKCKEKGVFINSDGVHHNILKIKPPLIFNKDNVDLLCKVLKECFHEYEEIQKKQKQK